MNIHRIARLKNLSYTSIKCSPGGGVVWSSYHKLYRISPAVAFTAQISVTNVLANSSYKLVRSRKVSRRIDANPDIDPRLSAFNVYSEKRMQHESVVIAKDRDLEPSEA